MTDAADADTYALRSGDLAEVPAPDIAYQPPTPTRDFRIGVIGTGGIVGAHLDAYRSAGWQVAAMWNRTRDKAAAKAAEFCPDARVEDDWRAILDNPDVDVVDITLHPEHRTPMVEAALKAGKHVLSQKPFVTNLDAGEALVKLADDKGARLAVNQNGRWSPYMAWMRGAVRGGHIGQVLSAHVSVHWDHHWTAGTPFDRIADLVLYDFGIHWFDFLMSIVGDRAESVFASATRAADQTGAAPLLAQALVRLNGGQASAVFDGATRHGARDTTVVTGTAGSVVSDGPDLGRQAVTLTTEAGIARPKLDGTWFNDGFRGAMGELMSAIEDGREPLNGARENLQSLALTFAAVKSRHEGREVAVGAARTLEG